MQKKDCTQCLYLSNYGCSKGQPLFSPCEWFVAIEEVKDYFKRADGESALHGWATTRPGKKD